MDHISKALMKAKEARGATLRQWVSPGVNPATAHEVSLEPQVREKTFVRARTESADMEFLAKSNMLARPENENPVLSDYYRVLRTRIKQKMEPMGWTKLGVTSAASQAGKTFTALNLAITMARASDDDVILIDCDVRNPSVAKGLGITVDVGLVDFLAGSGTIEETMFALEHRPNLKVIPGRIDSDRHERFEAMTGPLMRELFDSLQAESPNSRIIVDLPPVLVGDEVLGIAPSLDAFLFIVRDGKTNIDSLKTAMDMLQDFEVLGTVLNDCDDNRSNYAGYAYGVQTNSSR